MRLRFVALLLTFSIAATALTGQASGETPAPGELVDRVVAIVDEEPILLSDLKRAIGLGLVTRKDGEADAALLRRTLDEWIERRIRLNEISRFGFEEVPLEEVERQLERLRSRFPDEAAWQAELAGLGLGEAEVRQILARQLAVLSYLEQRLGPRAFVSIDEIQRYYDEELTPKLQAVGDPVPSVDEVREAIRALLRERKLDGEIARWTAELRREADVVDLLDVPDKPLPPVVLTFESAPATPP